MKMRLMKIGKLLLILLVVWNLLQLGVYLLIEFGARPVRITELDGAGLTHIETCTGVSLPTQAQFAEGYRIPGRDPSELYIFDLDTSGKPENETDDAYLRRELRISYGHSATGSSQFTNHFQYILPEIDDPFAEMIKYLNVDYDKCHYAYIHYCRMDGNTIRIALEFGFM